MKQFECTIENDNGMKVVLRYTFPEDIPSDTIELWIINVLLPSLNQFSLDLDSAPFKITHIISKRFQ